jgi:hypothetical protein
MDDTQKRSSTFSTYVSPSKITTVCIKNKGFETCYTIETLNLKVKTNPSSVFGLMTKSGGETE